MTLLGYFWDRWPSLASKLSWDITTIKVNSALHPSVVAKSSTSFGWSKSLKVTAAGWHWQVTLCDPTWHVISRSGVVISITSCCHYFPSGLRSPSQPMGITVLWPIPSHIAWWQRHIGVNNLPKVVTQLRSGGKWTHGHDLYYIYWSQFQRLTAAPLRHVKW